MSSIAQITRNLPPENLDFEGALQLVFPKWDASTDQTPKRTWVAGKKPFTDDLEDQELALEQIDILIANAMTARDRRDGRSILLKKAEYFLERGIACPYYYARLGIAFAVKQAGLAKKNDQLAETSRAEEQDEIYRMAGEIIKKIEDLHRRFPFEKIHQLTQKTGRFGHPIKPELGQRNVHFVGNLLMSSGATLNSMDRLKVLVSSERQQYVKRGNPDIWMASFITALGYLWCDLMDADATSKGKFSDFVQHSYVILGGFNDKSWNRRIDTSLRSTPEGIYRNEYYSLVKAESLLACEVRTNELLGDIEAAAIIKALEMRINLDFKSKPDEIIRLIQDNHDIPVIISNLIKRVSWSAKEFVAETIGTTVEDVEGDMRKFRIIAKEIGIELD